jgi:N-acetylglutamate synthase-like GNAT family acetyltransferase
VISLRRATLDDVEWLVELFADEDTEPFLGGGLARDAEGIREVVERSQREPKETGRMIVELDGERAGTMGFDRVSEAHGIARLGGLAVHPEFRGRDCR